ncbi:MAG: hypothetical protein AB9869_13315 [Verrucomicrobiia bacterium]
MENWDNAATPGVYAGACDSSIAIYEGPRQRPKPARGNGVSETNTGGKRQTQVFYGGDLIDSDTLCRR